MKKFDILFYLTVVVVLFIGIFFGLKNFLEGRVVEEVYERVPAKIYLCQSDTVKQPDGSCMPQEVG